MRFCFYCFLSLGFLALIAVSWHAPGTSPAPAVTQAADASLFQPTRTPASSPRASLDDIHRLEACYQSQTCNVPHSDARDYRRAVSEALAVALAEHFTNFGADAELARSEILSPEPLVQAVALRMLGTLPPSGENLSALGNGLRNASDPALIAGAVSELRRYLGTSYETDAQKIVEEIVGYGAVVEARQAASMVSPFINE
ncbi:MAG: hypothetical protein ACXWSD_15430, partial [Bdellovibrionota bacterium]